jgi:hypothetical protein
VYSADHTTVLFTLASVGTARVAQHRTPIPSTTGIPTVAIDDNGVTGLPAPTDGITLVVSAAVLREVPHRDNLLAPDTDRGAVRDANGQIVGTTGFVRRTTP